MRTYLWTGLIVLMTITLTACESRQTGKHGELIFSYDTDVDVNNFNKPMAIGSSLEMRIGFVGDEDETPQVVRAKTRDGGPILVEDSAINLVGLKAKKAGRTRLKVLAKDDSGKTYKDVVSLRAAAIHSVDFGHACTDEVNAIYMANTRNLAIPFHKFSDKKEPLIGYGVYPVTIEPKDAASIRTNSTDAGSIVLDFAPTTKTFKLRSMFSQKVLTFKTITKKDINKIEIGAFDRNAKTTINATRFIEFTPRVGKQSICNPELFIEARSLTPEICKVSTNLEEGQQVAQNQMGMVKITGLRFGVCKYEAWYPEADPKARGSYQIEVGQYPSDMRKDKAQYDDIESEDPLARNVPRISAEPKTHPLDPKSKPWWFTPLLALLAPLMLTPLFWMWRRQRT